MSTTVFRHSLPDAQATLSLGSALAQVMPAACVIWLRGDLGAGKTTLARGAIQHFDESARVRSPTYALIETYVLERFTLHHLDLYRVRDPAELEPLGLREFDGDVLLIEWPEKGGDATPAPDLDLTLLHADDEQRLLEAVARTDSGRQLLSELQQFLEITGYE